MPLTTGTRLGPYEILKPLGAGGMGEVYRAVDTRLDRTVAIKILPRELAANPSRQHRFEREARALSAVNHPHICTLYDLGEHDGIPFLVMEYVEGQTLGERLLAGPLPIHQLLQYAIEIVDALEHAHRHGIVHRDLKPANIMLTKAGVKVLDFGVAKLVAPDAARAGTRAETLTEDGTIVGTPQYMAPEQLEGRSADARSDIFAFGAVVFEMATGQPAFAGTTPVSVITAILKHDPPSIAGARPDPTSPVPPLLDSVVTRCLAKDPNDRWQTASDLRQALTWIADGTKSIPAAATHVPKSSRVRMRWLVAAAVIIVSALAAIAATLLSRRGSSEAGSVQFSVPPPPGASFNPSAAFLAVSPDGRSLVFAASARDGNNALWVRPINSVASRQLPGADGVQPFWSADGRFIAFSNSDALKKIEVASGVITTIAPRGTQAGAWNRDGTILFHRGQDQGGLLYRVAASGGQAVPVTTLDMTRKEFLHNWPQWLPDGRHFLYLARSSDPQSDGVVYVGSLDSATRTKIIRADSHAAYSPSGHLLFIQSGSLVAQAFDARTSRLSSEPVVVAEEVEFNPLSYRGAFSVSETGVLAYRSLGDTEFRWFDRNGRAIGSVGAAGQYKNPVLSPDDQRLAVGRLDPEHRKGWDIWTIELARGVASRITVRENADAAVWSPDGSELAFKSGSQFARRPANGTGRSTPVFPAKGGSDVLVDWSPDGRSLICQSPDPKTRLDLWTVPLSGDGTSTPIVQTEFQEMQARVAPNGRWIAYVSNESGRYEIYLRPFPAGDAKWRISIDGGMEPVWRRDGSELFFLAPDRGLMAVSVGTDHELVIGRPERLFQTRMSTVVNTRMMRNQYAVSGDGRRFLIGEPSGETPPITVVLNWTAALKQ